MYDKDAFTAFAGMAMAGMVMYAFAEMAWVSLVSKQRPFKQDFLQPLKNFPVSIFGGVFLGNFIPWLATAGLAIIASKLSPLSIGYEWYAWILALLIYELGYWIQHFLAHKVRLFWCIHSPHHAPNTINMLVGTNHHVLEGLVYFPFWLGFVPALLGVPPEMVMVISFIDGFWGSFLHISPNVVKGRYGVLEHFLQTPSYHRAHHAKNVRYMDTNYNSITLFWDYVFRTREPLRDEEPVDYGITREVNTLSWWDVQFGEFKALWRDVKAAPGIGNKCFYLLMPPGWSHTGTHNTVAVQKSTVLQNTR